MKKSGVKRVVFFGVGFLLLMGLLAYAWFMVAGVRQKMKTLNEQSDVQLLNFDPLSVDSVTMALFREKNWLETRLILSKTDSIYLSVNFSDSLLHLEMKGVVLAQMKMLDFKYDRFFDEISPGAYLHLFATHVQVDSTFSTIKRVLVTIKKVGGANPDIKNEGPDTIKIAEPVHWISWLDNGIQLNIEGVGTDFPARNQHSQAFWIAQDFRKVAGAVRQIFAVELIDYHPEITLVLTDQDAKTIFRALPEKPFINFRF